MSSRTSPPSPHASAALSASARSLSPVNVSDSPPVRSASPTSRSPLSPPTGAVQGDSVGARNGALWGQVRKKLVELAPRDPELVRARMSEEDRTFLSAHRQHSGAFVRAVMQRFANRPWLKLRRAGEEKYTHVTFGETWRRIESVGLALSHSESNSQALLPERAFFGVLGRASPDWAVAQNAAHQLGCVVVPLPSTLGADDLSYMIGHAELRVLAVSTSIGAQTLTTLADALTIAAKAAQPEKGLRALVLMDRSDETAAASAALERIRTAHPRLPILTLEEIEKRGEALKSSGARFPTPDIQEQSLRALLYTSGSTGRPKAAEFTERIWFALLSRDGSKKSVSAMPYIGVGYLPLNHVAGLSSLLGSLGLGGTLALAASADLSTILDDFRLARPTNLLLVPRVVEMIHDSFRAEVERAVASAPSGSPRSEVEAAVTRRFGRTALGDRLGWIVVSTAPLAPALMEWLQATFEVPVLNTYGQTETGIPIMTDGRLNRSSVSAYKLISVPELGYSVTDKPYPRGALCVKPLFGIRSYYRASEASAKLYDAEGYLLTGDVVEERGPWSVVYVDRVSNVMKLAQGEFVALAKLEAAFAESPLILQAYPFAESTRSFLVAVVVPRIDAVRVALGERASDASAVKSLLLTELQRVGSANSFQAWEVPRDIIVELEPFSQANQLLTESNKLARAKLKAKYASRLNELYEIAEKRSERARAELRDPALPPAVKVLRCVAGVLGLEHAALTAQVASQPGLSFVGLGGDSMGAVRLAAMLKDVLGAHAVPPAAQLLAPSFSLEALVKAVEARVAAGVPAPAGAPGAAGAAASFTYAAVHGSDDATEVRAGDLDLRRFLPPPASVLAAAQPVAPTAAHVLLTGANGYLGRFILLQLLRDLGPAGRVTVLVRAPNDAGARSRFEESLEALRDPIVSAGDRVQVLAGDLMLPHFGLTPERHDRLAAEVDTVVHNGALVNHAWKYPDLFLPNVAGTFEIIKFCLQTRLKPLTFLSSVAVASGVGRVVSERDSASKLWPSRVVRDAYADGYAASKWASEVQLEQLAREYKLPVNIIRCSMILASTRYDGEINPSDFLSRLLLGLAYTGLRPASFYAPSKHWARPHFDGLPVDVHAELVSALAVRERSVTNDAPLLLHAVNSYDDGLSLDTWVGVLTTSGVAQMSTVEPYASWLSQYGRALRSLPPARRERTNEAILFQWLHPWPVSARAPLCNDAFVRYLTENTSFKEGPPHLTPEYMRLGLEQLTKRGLLPSFPNPPVVLAKHKL